MTVRQVFSHSKRHSGVSFQVPAFSALTLMASWCAFFSPTGAWAQTPAATPQAESTVKPAAAAEIVDAILVTVADEIILLSDLQKAVAVASRGQTTLLGSGKLEGGALSPADVEKVLDQLINQKVLAIKARELALQVTDDELTIEIENFLKSQNATMEKLQESLKAEGETMEGYREEFRRQLESQRVIGRIIRPTVSVTDDDVRSYYLQQPGVAEKQQRVKLRSLNIDLTPGLAEAQLAERKANVERIEKEIRAAAKPESVDFESLVKLYSNDPEAMKGGQLEPRDLKSLPTELRAKVTPDLKEGTVLGPITIGSSVFFFQYMGTTLGNEAEFEKQKAQLKNALMEAKGNERLAEYVGAERTKTKVERRSFKFFR